MSKVLSIVGKAPGYDKVKTAEGDVWCVSSAFHLIEKMCNVDLIFNLHKPHTWEAWLPPEMERVMVAFPSLYLQYPVKEILKKYGPVFGSSISWMIALAIKEEYNIINLFGLEMATHQEYIDQRDTLFYMIGRAEALGIEVNIPEDSRIFFKDRIYGVM